MDEDHNMPNYEIQELMIGFFSGSISSQDMKRLNDWLEQDRSHIAEFNRMFSAWMLAHHRDGKKAFDTHAGWLQLRQRITNIRSLRFARWMTPMRYAASLVFCIVMTAVAMMWRTRDIAGGEEQANSIVLAATIIQSPMGSKSNITLPDGSSVWLNAGSTLTYPADFGLDTREIQLAGEAFFDVRSDSLMPFLVHTNDGITVQAKGTRFNVMAYPDDEMIIATLEEGRLNVLIRESEKAPAQKVELSPNQQYVVRKSKPQQNSRTEKTQTTATQPLLASSAPKVDLKSGHVVPNVKTELATSWKDAQWIVADEPLSSFATQLERRYNLKIHFDTEEVKNYKITGIFENETVEQILKVLSLGAPVNYQLNKNQVILSLNRSNKDKFQRIKK